MNRVLPDPVALETLVRAAAFQALLNKGEPIQPPIGSQKFPESGLRR